MATPPATCVPREAPGSAASSSAPNASGYQASRLPNSTAIANGSTSGATAMARIAIGRAGRASSSASRAATSPKPSVAPIPHSRSTTPFGSHETSAIAWATGGGYE